MNEKPRKHVVVMTKRMTETAQPGRVDIIRNRVRALYTRAGNEAVQNPLLSAAFEELAFALEEMMALEQTIEEERNHWLDERAALANEVQRCQELFVAAPTGYLITSPDGTIRMANNAAATLLESTERGLIGRSIAMCIPGGRRRSFHHDLANVVISQQLAEWQIPFQSLAETAFNADITVAPVRSGEHRVTALRWIIRRTAPQSAV